MSVCPWLLDLFDVLIVLDGVGVDLSIICSRSGPVHLLPQSCQITSDDVRGAPIIGGPSLAQDIRDFLHLDVPCLYVH